MLGRRTVAQISSMIASSILGIYVAGPSKSHSSPALRPSKSRRALSRSAVLGASTRNGRISSLTSTWRVVEGLGGVRGLLSTVVEVVEGCGVLWSCRRPAKGCRGSLP